MNTKQALELLKIYNITSSEQMLRRWIRQGKIIATKDTNKSGYNDGYKVGYKNGSTESVRLFTTS